MIKEDIDDEDCNWINEEQKPSINEQVLCSDGGGFFWKARWNGFNWELKTGIPTQTPKKWSK